MSDTFSDDLKQLIDSTPVFAVVATVQPDGSSQQSVVWLQRDGGDLLFSTTVGRRKEQNPRRDPRVSIMANPPNAPYTCAEIRGTAEATTEGGQRLIDELSLKYTGKKYRDFDPASGDDAQRAAVRATPRKVVGNI
ncbi:PPOX class F420-dependent oxidoreductase [Streptomyces sp. NPDC048279]|uniref:PPOX class F420-dependent oxidoreductase n=1 Tax=Streptomyces sp. NPDC048279 TaxID=3154714 RepID=UPI00343A177C